MGVKLTQKQLLRGSIEFEILGEEVLICIKAPFKESETNSVELAVLDPEPVITRNQLHFVSRVNGEPLLTLALSKPSVNEFNQFVNIIRKEAQRQYNTYSGIQVSLAPAFGNSDEEPPEFDEVSLAEISKSKSVNVEGLDNVIAMLKTYVNNEEIIPLLVALESLKQDPQNESKLVQVANVFNELGSTQGAVLTYAPYLSVMLSDDPFG